MNDELEVTAEVEQLKGDVKIGAAAELKTMGEVANALDTLSRDNAALSRVLNWVNQRYGTTSGRAADGARREGGQKLSESAGAQQGDDKLQFTSLADIFTAANPTTDADKALVVAYWYQVHENQAEWTGFAVHSQLKHLGHAVSNITSAIESLISQRPQLAIQTRKSGKSKQARKLYKLTAEGLKRVRQMVAQAAE
jgi:hypothetical protein